MPKLNPTLVASRRMMRMEKMARFELAGHSDIEIAMAVGCTKTYVSMLRQTPEYITIRMHLASGVLSSVTNDMEEDIQASTDQLKQMVPQAVFVLRDTMHNANPKLKFEAAREVLDREGTLAKVSKSEIKVRNPFDFNSADPIGQDLLQALQANVVAAKDFITAAQTAEAKTQKDIEAVLSFEDAPPASDAIN